MQHWQVSPSSLKGSMQVPASKSQSIRAILFALLAKGKTIIKNLLPSPDVEAMLTACSLLGAHIERFNTYTTIQGLDGHISGAEDVIQAGNSGLILRLLGAISALGSKPVVITGDASIRHQRPVQPLIDALAQLNVEAISLRGDGSAPILVRGPLTPGITVINGEDSQPVSGMIIASAFAPGPIEICVTQPGEKPWIDLTLDWLQRLKIPFSAHNYRHYHLNGNARIQGFEYTIPSDFSSVSYPLAAAILTKSEMRIENLDFNDPQGDKKVISLLKDMGALIEIDEKSRTLFVKKTDALQGIPLAVNDCIDATPLLAVVGCFAEGKTEITGAAIARKKESDRLSCITQELKKMGALIEEHGDGLTVYHSTLQGDDLYSHKDHRIALSLAVAGMCAKGETQIKDIACVEKSFPFFCHSMQRLGAHIQTLSW